MKGVLLVNLGSPDSPKPKDVKKYLDEFLMDERVIDVPYLLRAFLVKGIILNTRPKKSAAAYKKIWTDKGSPLIVFSEKLKVELQGKLDMPVALAMRYGSMSIEQGLQQLVDQNVQEILLISLYPQYAMSTSETVAEKVKAVCNEKFKHLKIDVLPPFYDKDLYINALVKSIQNHMADAQIEHLLFSYHGVPERHIRKSDITQQHCTIDGNCCEQKSDAHAFCYRHQCLETTRQVVEKLNLAKDNYTTSFQSRLGRDPWLQPYTAKTLEKMPRDGKKNIAVVTPSFVSDCLETLEEMEMENKEIFMDSGGEQYNFIPCLNDNEQWVEALETWCSQWKNEQLNTLTLDYELPKK